MKKLEDEESKFVAELKESEARKAALNRDLQDVDDKLRQHHAAALIARKKEEAQAEEEEKKEIMQQ